MRRVAALMSEWAASLGFTEQDRIRWTAAGWLHDALKEADPEVLRASVPEDLRDLAPALLHGPAAAERLANDADPALLDAIRYHTIGHPRLDVLGRALYLADFLEPGRESGAEWRAELRADMPHGLARVLPKVVAARVDHVRDRGQPIRPETKAFHASLDSRQ
jgi:HD superfamily phosphohydrolase YqeK